VWVAIQFFDGVHFFCSIWFLNVAYLRPQISLCTLQVQVSFHTTTVSDWHVLIDILSPSFFFPHATVCWPYFSFQFQCCCCAHVTYINILEWINIVLCLFYLKHTFNSVMLHFILPFTLASQSIVDVHKNNFVHT